jgi:hypothetical protein
MATIAATIAVAFVVAALVKALLKYWSHLQFTKEVVNPGLPLPLVGHSHLFYNVNREDILDTLLELAKVDTKNRKMGAIIGNERLIWYFHPKPVEEILSSNEHISKSAEYIYLIVSRLPLDIIVKATA